MKKLIYPLMMLFLLSFASAQAMNVGLLAGGGAAAATCTQEGSETFTDDDDWNDIANNTWQITGSEYDNYGGASVSIYILGQTTTLKQWILWRVASDPVPGTTCLGVQLRVPSTTLCTGVRYGIRYEGSGQDLVGRECGGGNHGNDCDDCDDFATPASGLLIFDFVAGDDDYFGVYVEGTGAATIFKAWDFGAVDPGPPTDNADIEHADNWGPADYDDTIVAPTPDYADVGKYIGVYGGGCGQGQLDDIEFGSCP